MVINNIDMGGQPGKLIDLSLPRLSFLIFIVFSTLLTAGTSGAAPAQKLDPSAYRLIGIIEAGGFSGAVLGDSTGQQTFYRLHEKLPDGSELVMVGNNRVSVKRSDGMLYQLFIAHDSTTASRLASPPPSAGPAESVAAPERPLKKKTSSRRGRSGRRSSDEEQ